MRVLYHQKKKIIKKGLIERLGNLKIKFNLNCFEYSGEGKINTFMIK